MVEDLGCGCWASEGGKDVIYDYELTGLVVWSIVWEGNYRLRR
jgi:hypothetical protein